MADRRKTEDVEGNENPTKTYRHVSPVSFIIVTITDNVIMKYWFRWSGSTSLMSVEERFLFCRCQDGVLVHRHRRLSENLQQ
jgi:hypothetical protein